MCVWLSDVDECEKKPCDNICTNTVGSYKCECNEGFVMKDGQEKCKGTYHYQLYVMSFWIL